MKSLQNVQKLAKIISVFVKVGYVLTIVGLVFCCLGVTSISIYGKNAEFIRLFEQQANQKFDFNVNLCYSICGVIECSFLIALFYYTKKYFYYELQVGTPFNKDVVKRTLKLGILHIVLPTISAIIQIIIIECFNLKAEIFSYASFSVGLVYLVLALIFNYGADLKNGVDTITLNQSELNAQSFENSNFIVTTNQNTSLENVIDVKNANANIINETNKVVDIANDKNSENLDHNEDVKAVKTETKPKTKKANKTTDNITTPTQEKPIKKVRKSTKTKENKDNNN